MASHEQPPQSDEWYTPYWVFDALGHYFDFDPCCSRYAPAVEYCRQAILDGAGGLDTEWAGSVWLNPPFGGRNGIKPWLDRLAHHGDGIALVPNRTGSQWWQDFAQQADGLLFVRGKIRFVRDDGTEGASPGYGNVMMAYGRKMAGVLRSSAIRGVRA